MNRGRATLSRGHGAPALGGGVWITAIVSLIVTLAAAGKQGARG